MTKKRNEHERLKARPKRSLAYCSRLSEITCAINENYFNVTSVMLENNLIDLQLGWSSKAVIKIQFSLIATIFRLST